jgi:hypothetical protein
MSDELGAPKIVDRSTFHAELDASLFGEKAHAHEGDAIAATGPLGGRAFRRPGNRQALSAVRSRRVAGRRDRKTSAFNRKERLRFRPRILQAF